MSVGYGQNVYDMKADAVAAIDKETFVDPPNAITGLWIATVVCKKGTLDLSNIIDNEVINRQHL